MRRKLLACGSSLVLAAIVGCEGIVDPIGDPVALSFAPCIGTSDSPTWFAFQDGDGEWQRVTPTSGAFNFSISSGKGAIAYYEGGDDPKLFVRYETTEEFQASMPTCTSSVRSVASSVTGYSSLDGINFTLGSGFAQVFGSQAPPAAFTLSGVEPTASDLIGIRYRNSTTIGGTFERTPNSVVIRRNVTGTSTPMVDFTSATEAAAPVQRSLNVTNLSSGEELALFSYLDLASTAGLLATHEAPAAAVSGSTTAPFWGVAGTRLNSGESQTVYLEAHRAVSSSTDEYRISSFSYVDPTDRSLTFGPVLGPISVTGSSRPHASYTVQAAYDEWFDVVFEQGSGSSYRKVRVLATAGYLDGASSVTLAVPDLSGVSGFSSSWLLVPGVLAHWNFLATDASVSALIGKAGSYQGAIRAADFTP